VLLPLQQLLRLLQAASKLASTLGHYLTGLTLDSAAARDVPGVLSGSTGGGSIAGEKHQLGA
jgi:hypothetical protein